MYIKISGFILFIFVIFSVDLPHSFAATYYVDQNHPQASDSNPGTENSPWNTLYKAAQMLVAGDTVLVKAGTYDASVGGDWNIPSINPTNSGTLGNPITFKAYPGDTVNLIGGATPAIGSKAKNYITIDGFTVVGSNIIIFGSSSLRSVGAVIQNNVISGLNCGGGDNCAGIRFEDTSGTVIRNNLIFDVHNAAENHNAAGILMYQDDNAIIENNEIYDAVAGIFEKDEGTSNTFRYNYIHDTLQVGISIHAHNSRSHRDDKVYSNIVTRAAESGIKVDGSSSSPNINTIVYNNTVTNSPLGIPVSFDSTNAQAWNNLIYSSPRSSGLVDDNPSMGYCDYNLMYLAPPTCGSNSVTSDPQFVSTSFQDPADFKLQSSSPARGAGRNNEDIGAYATGSERIGLMTSPTTTSPPIAPTGLTVK